MLPKLANMRCCTNLQSLLFLLVLYDLGGPPTSVNPSTPPRRGPPPEIAPPRKKGLPRHHRGEKEDTEDTHPPGSDLTDYEKENHLPHPPHRLGFYHRLREKLEDAIKQLQEELETDLLNLFWMPGTPQSLY
nr:MAG: early protein 4 [Ailuropoda melanoleuca papillomavirus 5]